MYARGNWIKNAAVEAAPQNVIKSATGQSSYEQRPSRPGCEVFDIYSGETRMSVLKILAGCKP
jgi:hypothetical protein